MLEAANRKLSSFDVLRRGRRSLRGACWHCAMRSDGSAAGFFDERRALVEALLAAAPHLRGYFRCVTFPLRAALAWPAIPAH